MKKLAILLLATVMLFTCFALAACGDGEESSTPSTSKTASDNKSDAATTSDASSGAATSSKDETTSDETTSEPETTSDETTSEPETTSDETTDDTTTDDTSGDDGNLEAGDASPFWITHYDDPEKEGAGMILTDTDSAGVWCDHYAFKPIEGVENGFELVAFSYGTIANGNDADNGHGEKLDLPEGGFIYATSIGNDYPSLNMDGPNYVNNNCNEQISRCRTWKVGDKFVITGLDLEGKTVPTTTDDKNWYDSDYVCTATIAPLA